jgi:hypothetical protein
VDAGGRGFPCAPGRRHQRREPLAGSQRQPRTGDGHPCGTRGQPCADRPSTARRESGPGCHCGFTGLVGGLRGHPPHTGRQARKPGPVRRGQPRSVRAWLRLSPLPPDRNPGWTDASDNDGAARLEALRPGRRKEHRGRSGHGSYAPRAGSDGICFGDHSAGWRRSPGPKFFVPAERRSGIQG